METKFEIVAQMFHGYDYRAYFRAETTEKLSVLIGAHDFIVRNEDIKNRFLSETLALSKLFVMTIPSEAAERIKEQVAFFQAIKSRINKFSPSGGKSDMEVTTAIRQIVDDALSSDGVIDIFEAAGIATPSLDILSEEFLLEVKNMRHKNLAFELLKKLLSEEVKVRKHTNIVQGKKFSEMLATVIKRYQNNQIDTAQVIEELSEIARDMHLEDKKAKDVGLTPEEYAFYSILSENNSTKFLEDYKNATVDWDKREDVKAQLRLAVKRALIRYGYPPDLARIEADRVLEQSELLAGTITR